MTIYEMLRKLVESSNGFRTAAERDEAMQLIDQLSSTRVFGNMGDSVRVEFTEEERRDRYGAPGNSYKGASR